MIIDAIQQDLLWWPEIQPMYVDARKGRIEILVSEICIAETSKLNGVTKKGVSIEAANKLVLEFFDNPFIFRRPADRRESALAAELVRQHDLDTCDALIAATAIVHGAEVLYTRDGLKKKPRKKQGLLACDGKLCAPHRGRALVIRAPNAAEYLEAGLFAKNAKS